MPTKKADTAVTETGAEGEAKPKRSRKTTLAVSSTPPIEGATGPTPKAPRKKKAAATHTGNGAAVFSGNGSVGSVSAEDIAVRAYFISEHRRALGLGGSSETDWLEAERQLRSEASGIAASLKQE
jgi:hypothetical protein